MRDLFIWTLSLDVSAEEQGLRADLIRLKPVEIYWIRYSQRCARDFRTIKWTEWWWFRILVSTLLKDSFTIITTYWDNNKPLDYPKVKLIESRHLNEKPPLMRQILIMIHAAYAWTNLKKIKIWNNWNVTIFITRLVWIVGCTDQDNALYAKMKYNLPLNLLTII